MRKQTKHMVFQRLLSLALALTMLVALLPAGAISARAADEDVTLYLKPTESWVQGNERYAAYFFEDGKEATWIGLEEVDGEDGYYQVVVPEGYSNVIFCRMNGEAEENSWNNKWDQTKDLKVPDDDNNCYTIGEQNSEGEWSVYVPEEPEAPGASYYVAGDSTLCGSNWQPQDAANQMTKNGAVYKKVFTAVAAGTYNIKVTDGTWDNAWGDNGQNYQFKVTETCDVTVTFDPAAETVSISGDHAAKVTEMKIDAIYAVGNGSGAWLNGESWNVGAEANKMTQVASGIYEIAYKDVPTGSYEVKFAANGTWADSWGGAFDESGAETVAVHNGGNINFDVTIAAADVKLQLDLTNFDYSSKNGAKFTITIAEPQPTVPAVDYYLVGYINSADYDGTDYKFENGKLTASFTAESYVAVKASDKEELYMTEGWLGNDATSATLSTNAAEANKLYIPANTEVEFSLAVNSDGTLTLSYTKKGGQTPADTIYYVAGDGALCGNNWQAQDTANQMDKNGAVYEKVFKNAAAGSYQIKITDSTGAWHGDNGGDSNYTFKVTSACDVTVSFDPATGAIAASGDHVAAVTDVVFEAIYAVGNGSGAWLNGESWNAGAEANKMTQVADGVYEIAYPAVPAGSYEVKFAANGTWADSWGGAFDESGAETDAVYNGSNIIFQVSTAAADVKLRLDLTDFVYATKSGAKFSITLTEAEAPAAKYAYILHFANPSSWETVNAYTWMDGSDPLIEWPGTAATANAANDGWYDITFTDIESAQLNVIFNCGDGGEGKQTADLTVSVPEGATGVEAWIGGLTEADVAYTAPENWEIPGSKVTIHYLKPETWGSNVNAYVWIGSDQPFGSWPGSPISANAEHEGWYDLVYYTDAAFNFIFNSGSDQTADLATGAISGDTELWVMGDRVLTEAPGEWNGIYTYSVSIHFHNTAAWTTVNAKFGQGDSWTPVPGYEDYKNEEFGAAMAENADNLGWYTVSFDVVENNDPINGLFDNGAWGAENQTANWTTGTLERGKNEFWYDDGALTKEMPDDWFDADVDVYIPGTFPGPGWDPASNKMAYDRELGLYVYTFKDVPPANYEFKIAINGTWDENYGMKGVPGGDNIAVTVPKDMDVTVYYSHKTHRAVTNVDYVFADITLTGTGIPEGTKMTDAGLTGFYSATVKLPAGSYDDIALTYEGGTCAFEPFELAEEKEVTFYFDPSTGIYYHNASDEKIDASTLFYDSRDIDYKDPYGAVEQGSEVTFTLDTGIDITGAKLVVKGLGNFDMTSEDLIDPDSTDPDEAEVVGKKWTGTAVFPNVGEFDYYFIVTNGSDMKVYCDDDGFYGTGMVADMTEVDPYDLVVYKAGYETPDWMKDAVIYQIFPDRFFDGDPSNNKAQLAARGAVDYEYIKDWYTLPENPEQEVNNPGQYPSNAHKGDGEWSNEIYGGDLEGISQKIPYLKSLGVNVIYLNPVFSSISNHRYDTCDYMQIDPILGDLGDFEELVRLAEANGMHIILDGVFNHVSDDSIYFDRYYKFLGRSGNDTVGAYPYWAYVYDYMAEHKVDQQAAETAARAYFSEAYGVTDFSYTEWFDVKNSATDSKDTIGKRIGKPVYAYEGWWGYDSMPVIKSTNGSEYRTGNWASEIIDGSGSVTKYWISKGSDGWRLDVANEVSDETWQHFRRSVKAMNSDAVIVGEIWDDATKYLMGDMYDSVMNYVFRDAVTGFALGEGFANGYTAEEATNVLERMRERYPSEAFYAMMNLVGSHDTTRILSYLDGIVDDRKQTDIDSAFPTYEGTSSAAKERQYLVSFLQFTYPGAPTIYYGDEIGMVGADDPDDRRAMTWGKGNRELVEWYAELAAVRAAYPALRTGDLGTIDTGDAHLMGFTRTLGEQGLIVVANSDAATLSFTPETPYGIAYTDVISGASYDADAESYPVPGRKGIILVPTADVVDVAINAEGLKDAYAPSAIVPERDTTAHKHDYQVTVVAPTCTEDGYTHHVCVGCGDSFDDNIVSALGHDMKESEHKAPTCTEDGYTKYRCTRCGLESTEVEKATGHDMQESEHKAPTCTEDGYTKYRCKHCGTETTKVEKATGHDNEQTEHKAPTCTEDGYTKYRCKHCGTETTKVEKATGHDMEKAEHKAPTCTEDGYTKYRCKHCGTETTEVEKALGHDNQKTAHKDPTCTKDGYTKYHCSRCGKDFTEVEKATGHGTLELKNAKDATCTKSGYTGDKVCTVCNKVVEKGKTIAKLPHDYQDGVCTVCNARRTTPQTGDISNATPYIVILIVATAGIVALIVVYNKKKVK